MKTKNEILEYLGMVESVHSPELINEIISIANEVECKYRNELENNVYGYGLQNDFENLPGLLEDTNLYELKEIENINDIVVYEKIKKMEDQ